MAREPGRMDMDTATEHVSVRIPIGAIVLDGELALPPGAAGVVLFAHGSGSSRHSPRNRFVAERLRRAGLGTLLMDLLTGDEEAVDSTTAHMRLDIGLLAERVVAAIDWLARTPATAQLPVGGFGASTGAAAALHAAADRPDRVAAVVSRGGRPDLAGSALARVVAPTLLLVGGADTAVLGMNQVALRRLTAATDAQLVVIPGATHLFEEPRALEDVARLAATWFERHLPAAHDRLAGGRGASGQGRT